MVSSVGFASLALLAKPLLAVGLCGKGCCDGCGVGRECAVTVIVRCASRRGEDCRGVAPYEHGIEEESSKGCPGSW